MPERTRKAYNDWKAADTDAREAEARLSQAWEQYERRAAEPPSAELIAQVSALGNAEQQAHRRPDDAGSCNRQGLKRKASGEGSMVALGRGRTLLRQSLVDLLARIAADLNAFFTSAAEAPVLLDSKRTSCSCLPATSWRS